MHNIRKLALLLLVFASFSHIITAQKNQAGADSLLMLIKRSQKEKESGYLLQLTSLYLNNKKYPEAIHSAKTALTLSRKLINLNDAANAEKNLGKAYYFVQKFDSARYYLEACMPYFRETKQWQYLEEVHKYHYYTYGEEGDFNRALTLSKEAQVISNLDPKNIHDNNSNVGYYYQMLKDYDSAEYYYSKALELRIKYSRHKDVIDSYDNLHYVYEITGRYEKQLEVIELSEKYCIAHLDSFALANAMFSKASFYEFLGDSSVLSLYFKTIDISEKSGNINVKGRTLMKIGDFYKNKKIFEKSLLFYYQALELFKQSKSIKNLAWAELSIGEVYLDQNKFDKAKEHIDKALQLNDSSKYEQQRPFILEVKASALNKVGRFHEALPIIDESISILIKHSDNHKLAAAQLVKADILINLKQFKHAEKQIKEVQNICNILKLKNIQANVYYTQYKLQNAENNFPKAIYYLKEHYAIQDSLSKQKLELQAEKLNVIYETEKKDRENKLLKHIQGNQQIIISKQRVFVFSIVIILGLTIILTISIFRSRERQRKATILLSKQNKEIAELNSSKDRFFSIIGHDLKNPFNSILGFLDLLTKEIRSNDIDTTEEQINIVYDSSKKVYNLLEDILMWARSQSGKIPFSPENLSLIDTCKDVIEDLKLNASNKNITIILLAKEETAVFADLFMIKTVLRNLISNAIKFTNSNGQIEIDTHKIDSTLTISISDNGIGIAEDLLSKLFDISQISTKTGTANESGTGLGLLICKDFITKHNGKIWAVSELGNGSEFKFTLPLVATNI